MQLQIGKVYLTAGINKKIKENKVFETFIRQSLYRHSQADWGELEEEDKKINNRALNNGGRLFSAYKQENLPKIWIITEANREITTILLPEEY